MQNTPPAPTPPTGTQTGTPSAAPQAQQISGGPYTAREMYEAAQRYRRTLNDQLSSAENEREQLAQRLRQPEVTGADRAGLEQRLKVTDIRVLDLQGQLADAQQREAQAASVPGATSRTREEISNNRFEIVFSVTTVVFVVLAIPLVIAWARRLWRKSSVTLSMTPELDRRLDSIERAIETTALEVERIGEGQRFVTQLMASRATQEAAALTSPKEMR